MQQQQGRKHMPQQLLRPADNFCMRCAFLLVHFNGNVSHFLECRTKSGSTPSLQKNDG